MEQETAIKGETRKEADFNDGIEEMHGTPTDLPQKEFRQDPGVHGSIVG